MKQRQTPMSLDRFRLVRDLLKLKLQGLDVGKFVDVVKAKIQELRRAGFDKSNDDQINMLFGMILINGVNVPAFQSHLDQALVKQELEGEHVRFNKAETTIRDWAMLVQ